MPTILSSSLHPTDPNSRLDYAANSWKYRWWLLDGWLALLYLAAFWAIAYLWRPTGSNRLLAMSEELAQEEPGAEDYDMAALERGGARGPGHPDEEDDDDAVTLVGSRRGNGRLADDNVVFEIGDEDAHGSDDDEHKPPSARGGGAERRGLMRDRDD